jgi:hypothetical protein
MISGMRILVPVFTMVFSLLFALALGLLGLVALSTGPSDAADQQLMQAEHLVSGVVASVDQSNLMIIMRTRFGRAQAFPVSSSEILKGITQGDAITVELDAQGVARRITKMGTP